MPDQAEQATRANARAIPDTLKEAVVDGLLNAISSRLSGAGDEGRVIFGTRPRNALACSFLLPQDPSTDGDEVTASIRISSHGFDLLARKDSGESISVQPHASVYLRVYPTADEIRHHPNCDPKFVLKPEIEKKRRARVRELEREALNELPRKRKDPKWPELAEQIRRTVHKELGIPYEDNKATDESSEEVGIETDVLSVDNSVGETTSGPHFSGRTNLPDNLAQDAAIPQKWIRLDIELPALVFRLGNLGEAITIADKAIQDAIGRRLIEWTKDTDPETGGHASGYRRSRKILPSDVQNWEAYLRETAASKIPVLLPTIILEWDIEVTPDFLNPDFVAVHIAIENRSDDPKTVESDSAVFAVHLEASIPVEMHRALMLDRVNPSYRFYRYLSYPALGFNGGVQTQRTDRVIRLTTTWTPRYHQPRIEPRTVHGVVTNIEALSKPDCLDGLRPLVDHYQNWLTETRSFPFSSGIDAHEADLIERERTKFNQDLDHWASEFEAIRVGIRILERSHSAWASPGPQVNLLAAPFEAWLAMNASMAKIAKAKGYEDWRLFQLAFILATLPSLVTRIPEFHDYYTEDIARQSNSVTLLYFATGGGKSEAFFGLLVFSLFLDRLRGKQRGVTSLVRYPLRLLTIQQAKRTADVLAQAELVRRRRNHLGEPFSIGFWVGSSNTPNSLLDEEVQALPDVKKYPASSEPRLHQDTAYTRALEKWNKLTQCPFCKGSTGLRLFPSLGGMLGHLCLDSNCEWHKLFAEATPLPFYIVDDDIYDFAPSVLLGTVDKLALLGQSQRTIRRFLGMFGFSPGYKASNGRLYLPDHRRVAELSKAAPERPFVALFPLYADGEKRFFDPFPALLIQDEAHLLDESLGTFAGLFETAMAKALDELGPMLGDSLAIEPGTTKRRYLKIIAASATVSDPEHQMRNIYQRANTIQFPYPGPDLYRSFYAEPKRRPSAELAVVGTDAQAVEVENQWARVYQSVLTNGHTHTVTMVETLAHFHTSITQLYEAFRSADPTRNAQGKAFLASHLSTGPLAPVFRTHLDRATTSQLATLVDLHRIALTYVTNKKGGDQIMAAESVEFEKKHLAQGLHDYRLQTDLITGAVDAGRIQAVIDRAENRPAVGKSFPELNESLRSIVATSAVSHGVDVEELNSMFFAGMPSDIAEYIQASSRVGRTHVGFCVLVPTPQRARDRYIVEVHDIFHRFLERMIAPAAIDRWAEKAIERVVASFLQTCLCGVRAIQRLATAPDSEKSQQNMFRLMQDAKDAERENAMALKRDIAQFIEAAVGLRSPYAPTDDEHYRGLIRERINDIFNDMSMTQFAGSELRKFLTQRNVELRPMLSLRDVDKPGRIVPADRDARDRNRAKAVQIDRTMRFIRGGSGSAIDDDESGRE